MADRVFLQTADAAKAAGLTPSAISRAVHEGRIRVAATTRHGTRLFDPDGVEEYIATRRERCTPLVDDAARAAGSSGGRDDPSCEAVDVEPSREVDGMGREARRRQRARIEAGLPANPTGERSDRRHLRVPVETLRFLTARHEAAHAVVAHALGLRVHRITLDAAEAAKARPDLDAATSRECGTCRENALVAMAGPLEDESIEQALGVQLRFDVSATGEHNDITSFLWSLMQEAGGDREKAEALVEPRSREAASLLDSRREALDNLASVIAERTVLDEAGVLDVLGPYPDVAGEVLREREALRRKLWRKEGRMAEHALNGENRR